MHLFANSDYLQTRQHISIILQGFLSIHVYINPVFHALLTLTTQPHQKIRFLEIFFRILNMFAIVSNLHKKKINFFRNPQK